MAGASRNCCHLSAFCVHHTTMHHVNYMSKKLNKTKNKKKSTNATEIKILHFYCRLIHVETSISASSAATSTSTCSSVVATGKEAVTMVRLSLAVVLLIMAIGEYGKNPTAILSGFHSRFRRFQTLRTLSCLFQTFQTLPCPHNKL